MSKSDRFIQDYVITRYIAEFINTLSSLVFGMLSTSNDGWPLEPKLTSS